MTNRHATKYQLHVRMQLFISVPQIIDNECNDKPEEKDRKCKK